VTATGAGAPPRISIALGDIVEQDVDVVVNAANSGLMGGGGVDGAILRAGGDAQLAARRELRDRIGPLPTGRAAPTESGAMRCRWVIHVVGPVFSATEDRSHQLASCYREALAVADELEASSIAFPAVSAGVFGWPIDSAADIAIATVAGTLTEHVVDVRFVLFNQPVYDEFSRALASL
jgi:O-acetyl-ADP-ribose deacetylase (regulator of RNase III)